MTLEQKIAKCQLYNTYRKKGRTFGKAKVKYCTLGHNCPYKGKPIYIEVGYHVYHNFMECLKE